MYVQCFQFLLITLVHLVGVFIFSAPSPPPSLLPFFYNEPCSDLSLNLSLNFQELLVFSFKMPVPIDSLSCLFFYVVQDWYSGGSCVKLYVQHIPVYVLERFIWFRSLVEEGPCFICSNFTRLLQSCGLLDVNSCTVYNGWPLKPYHQYVYSAHSYLYIS